MHFRARLIGLCLSATLAAGVSQAFAQTGPEGIGGRQRAANPSPDDQKKVAPPPAIPGAQAQPDQVAPASKTAKDLDPNAALFDAIDRGDLTAARDALNRGASLSARNVLGQRPLDMSIDLSRNAITFLLLSMRSQDADTGAGAPPSETTEADAEPVKPVARHRHPKAAAPVEFATAQRQAPSATAQQPSAGFLGFGSH